jgi:oligoendopeptidase F
MPLSFDSLPTSAAAFSAWSWPQIAPYYDELVARPLTLDTVDAWLADWSRLGSLLDEVNTRFTIATTTNTADTETEQRYNRYLDEIVPQVSAAEQRVKQHLLASGLEPQGFAMPLRKLRAEAEIFREANVPLLAELRKLSLEYDKLSGARTVVWEGQEIPTVQLAPVLQDPDRSRRERAWRTMRTRLLQDRDALAEIWAKMTRLRSQIAANAGFDTFRSYRWRQIFRFDYTPDDAKRFHDAIEQVVVPATVRLRERRRARLGLNSLRPWDLDMDASGRPALRPYQTIDELVAKTANVFRQVDPQFAAYLETMRAEKLLDLDSRKNKAAGGYSLGLNVVGRPFILIMNAGQRGRNLSHLGGRGHAGSTPGTGADGCPCGVRGERVNHIPPRPSARPAPLRARRTTPRTRALPPASSPRRRRWLRVCAGLPTARRTRPTPGRPRRCPLRSVVLARPARRSPHAATPAPVPGRPAPPPRQSLPRGCFRSA